MASVKKEDKTKLKRNVELQKKKRRKKKNYNHKTKNTIIIQEIQNVTNHFSSKEQ
jgi:hypothetical protein